MEKLGKLLKAIRFERGELLYDMAKRLNVSSAFLSAVENDKRSAPLTWLNIITAEYQLDEEMRNKLQDAIAGSIKQIRMDVETASSAKRNCALTFARNFDDFSDEDVQEIMAVLNKRRENE